MLTTYNHPNFSSAFLFRLYQPKYWYMPVVDIFRRLILTSGLIVIDDTTIQLLVAVAVSVSFVVTFREWKPFYEVETDTLFYICGKVNPGLRLSPHLASSHFASPRLITRYFQFLSRRLANRAVCDNVNVNDHD